MMNTTLNREIESLMRKAAHQAILPHYRALADHHVQNKAADDVVTVADHASEVL